MKTQTRVVVIGGGIAGCSTLYHLTQEGWTDVVLIERDELTSGTTWHSAAQVTNFGPVQTMVGLKTHSIALYKSLAEDPDYPINYHHACGGIRLAGTPDHLDGYHHFVSMAKGMGVDFEVIDADECAARHPLLRTDGLLGGLWDPLDGDIDPAQLCQALARRARRAGAEIVRHTPVEAIERTPAGDWRVQTRHGAIDCEVVVNAGGYRVNEIGRMLGVSFPVVSMEHQYFLTEPIAELEARGDRVPLLRCPIDDFYSRQEKQGLLVGIYEQGCKTWGLDGIDPDFANALCPNDLDRCLDNMERVFKRLPCLEEVGIHTIVNGPITYSADGLPLVGQIPGLRNAFCIVGLRAGVGEGGGHGKILAELIVHGESEWDVWCLDPRRFTGHATTEFTALKAIEDYQNEFRFHMPHEHRPAGRLAKTTPLYPVLRDAGAAFGVVNGWERATFFKPEPSFEETHSFRFASWHPVVADEVAAVRDRVGLMEVSGFNRLQLTGPGAAAWIDALSCSRVRREPGAVSLAYFLTERGNVLSEASVAVLDPTCVWFGSAAAAEYHDRDWLCARLPDDGVSLEVLTNTVTTLVVAGPRSRALLQSVSPRTDWSTPAFPWMHVQRVQIGPVPAVAMRVSFSGELAYELHVRNEHLLACYEQLWAAGRAFDLARFGLYATESMRIEKGYRHWKADLITEFNPYESGLARFVARDKSGYPGAAALAEQRAAGDRRRFVTLAIDSQTGPAHPGDSVLRDGEVVGTVTSAAYGYRVEKNLALAFVRPEHAALNTALEVLMLGERTPARVGPLSHYDPDNQRIRGV